MKFTLKGFYVSLLAVILIVSTLPFKQSAISAATNDTWSELSVVNGDFETEPASETNLPSWVYWSGGLKTGMKISDEVVFEGNQSLAVDNNGVVGLFSQEIAITEGTPYKLSAQLNVEELKGNQAFGFAGITIKERILLIPLNTLTFQLSMSGRQLKSKQLPQPVQQGSKYLFISLPPPI